MINTWLDPVKPAPHENLRHLDTFEATLGTTIIWNGAEYPCVAGPEFMGKRIDEGGYRLEAKLKIAIRAALFSEGTGVPQEKQTVLYKRSPGAVPKLYRIDAITTYSNVFAGDMLELNCNDPAQGA